MSDMENVKAHYERKAYHAKRRQERLDAWHKIVVPELERYGLKKHTDYHYSILLVSSALNGNLVFYHERCQIYPSTLKYVWKQTTHDLDFNKFVSFALRRLPAKSERD